MSLIARDISKSYGAQQVLDQVDLSLDRGEIVGLLGRNGAGKSTLLKIIAGINRPDDGELKVGDSTVGYMSERNPLYPHMYVTEYLTWVADMRSIKDVKSRVAWAVERVGLSDVKGKKINQLSKGYKQRVGLAATLLSDPDIIILDEPINGLDPIQITQYRALVKSIASDKIIILSSHLIQEIEALCDRVLLLKNGKIEEDRMLQRSQGGNSYTIILELNDGLDRSQLENLDGVVAVSSLGAHRYKLDVDAAEDIRTTIFDEVVRQGLKIIEMKKEQSSLQQIFQ